MRFITVGINLITKSYDLATTIQELEHEITVLNTPEFKWGINWSTTLQHMIEDNQHR